MEETKVPTIKCGICTRDVLALHKEKFCHDCGQNDAEVFKSAARLKKALKLAMVLASTGGNAADIHNASVRRLAEKVAGVNKSSDATWAMVAVLMSGEDE